MLTGSGGYLQPDYLKPLPTTLDAKNSPLALLAKTCSNIGKDESAKSIIPPIEKSDKQDSSPKSISPGNNRGSPLSNDKHDNRLKSSPERGATAVDHRFKMDLKDMHSPRHSDVMSPRKDLSGSPKMAARESLSRSSSGAQKSPSTVLPPHGSGGSHNKLDIKGSSSDSKISLNCGGLSLEINHKENNHVTSGSSHTTSTSPPSTSSHSYSHPLASSSKHAPLSHAGLLSAYYPHLALSGYPGAAAAALNGLHPGLSAETAALLAAQRQKSSESTPHVAVSYNPVKTASGATTLVPVCADPYCVSCKLAMQSAQLASPACGAGCTQCTREKGGLCGGLSAPTSLGSGYPGSLGALPGLHSLSGLYGHHHHHSSSSSSSLSGGGAHSSLPYVCSWVSGTSYCGEKFGTSEELMSHLRTHTTSLEQSALHSGLSPYSPLALAGLGSLYSPLAGAAASSISPSSLSRHYPRSLSPTSLLAASRYHPYLKPPSLSGLPTSLPSALTPSVHPPSLASAYPSLYPSLHASRYGSALVP